MSTKTNKQKHPASFFKFESREEQKQFWRWRLAVGALIKKELPAHIAVPLSKEDFVTLYKKGTLPHEVRDYVIYQLL